ncbi:17511_t:CDS:1, partial [Racocetra persica]
VNIFINDLTYLAQQSGERVLGIIEKGVDELELIRRSSEQFMGEAEKAAENIKERMRTPIISGPWSRGCSSLYGCHKGYCWAGCAGIFGSVEGFEWCYTKNTSDGDYVKCSSDKDCDGCW